MASSNIEWTDKVWNPIAGCTKVSPGCAHCYAETMAKRLKAMAQAKLDQGEDPKGLRKYLTVLDERGRWNGHVELDEVALLDPLSWRKPRRVFVNSMSDLFHEAVPFEFVDRVFAVMALCPQHKFQVLTKRPERMAEYFNNKTSLTTCGMGSIPETIEQVSRRRMIQINCNGMLFKGPGETKIKHAYETGESIARGVVWPLPNVWLGTSVENRAALGRINHLARCPAAVHMISFEPLLADLGDITPYLRQLTNPWAVFGGESGPGGRLCNVQWIRGPVQQCRAIGVPVFVKQLGSCRDEEPVRCPKCGKIDDCEGFDVMGADGCKLFCTDCHHEAEMPQSITDPKGGDPAEWPEDLRVREFPEVRS